MKAKNYVLKMFERISLLNYGFISNWTYIKDAFYLGFLYCVWYINNSNHDVIQMFQSFGKKNVSNRGFYLYGLGRFWQKETKLNAVDKRTVIKYFINIGISPKEVLKEMFRTLGKDAST